MIACNSASAAVLRDARERYPVPVVEVIFPATRRAVAATRNNRVGVICTRATAGVDGVRRRVRRCAAGAAAPPGRVRVSWSSSSVGSRADRRCSRSRMSYLDPLLEPRRRHADPRLHPLPAADRRDRLRPRRLGDAGVERRGDREGRLRDVGPARDRRAAGAARRRSTGSSRPGSPASSARSATGSSDPSSTSSTSSRLGGRMRADRGRVLGLPARARTRRPRCYLLEAPYQDGRPGAAPRPRQRRASGALQPHVDLRSIGAVAFTHLHADHCLDLCGFFVIRKHHPDGHWGSIPAYGPPGVARRMASAYDISRGPRDVGGVRLPRVRRRAVRIGPVHGRDRRHGPPGRRVRAPGDPRRPDAGLLGGLRPRATRWTRIAQGADLLLVEASFLEGEDNPEHLHLTGPEAGGAATAAGVGRLVLTHVPPWYDRERIVTEAAKRTSTGRVEVASPGLDLHRLRPPVRHAIGSRA